MSKTSIEWCARPGTLPEVWNLVTGCNKVSQGCKNCYAEIMHRRLQYMYPQKYDHDFLSGAHIHEDLLTLPFTWKKPRTVFVNSMSDLFHANVPFSFLNKVYAVMALCRQHTFIILTKRPENAKAFFDPDITRSMIWQFARANALKLGRNDFDMNFPWPIPNVWHLVSTEDQATADERIPILLQIPSAVYGISAEPLLGPIDLSNIRPGGTHFFNCLKEPVLHKGWMPDAKGLINWVIVGGESGHNARPIHPDWVRTLKNQCVKAKIPFFFKQWGQWHPYVTAMEEMFGPDYSLLKHHSFEGSKTLSYKVGKHRSGRILDQVEWNQFPLIKTPL